ncbi:MAG: four-carbon acid sugar kinase family protein [Candidatus Brockarchaeota archaeon]|nr:four-carbon acid sugar kinase family protein [Candidatus Brockarchaeota archaeon]
MFVGAVADDDSGMTDLLGMFAEHGMSSAMFFERQPRKILERYAEDMDVVAIGTRARSIEPKEAYRRTSEALGLLEGFAPRMHYLKYCSTFDSTPRGNIGQMIDAGLDLVGGNTIALAALPVNGRTTYMGNHFVDGIRLDRSHMKDHPLNPMKEADLVAWLGYQTKRRVGLCNYYAVRKGPRAVAREVERLGSSGIEIVVMDAIEQRDVRTIARAVHDRKLVSGSSALAMELPPIWRERGLLPKRRRRFVPMGARSRGGPLLVVSGSCAEATIRQNENAMRSGFSGIKLDAVKILEGAEGCREEVERAIEEGKKELGRGRNVLVYTASGMGDVIKAKNFGLGLGLTDFQIGKAISDANAEIAKALVDESRLDKLIVAGGETSGAVCKKMELIGLYVGKQIDPGVPVCFSISEDPGHSGIAMSLKSGNFGGPRFYEKALRFMDARVRP